MARIDSWVGLVVAVAAVCLPACSCNPPGNPDGGEADSGIEDGGVEDGGVADAGQPDAGRPNLMFLLDKSGSMSSPINPADPNCPSMSCPGPSCPVNCPTRISELKTAMGLFLTTNGSVARMGLTTFPTDSTCGAPNAVRVGISQSNDVNTELEAHAGQINQQIQGIGVSNQCGPNYVCGGTPLGPALTYLATVQELQHPTRADYVLLLTDGLPNCNPANVNNCTNVAACRCSTTNCGTDTTAPFCTLGCLDQSGTVAAINQLRAKAVRTIVVAYATDLWLGDAPWLLNEMAEAGGVFRRCSVAMDAGCGSGGTCDEATGLCNSKLYWASNAVELLDALNSIALSLRSQP